MLSYYVILYEKFRKVMQRTEKVALSKVAWYHTTKSRFLTVCFATFSIPAKPLHNHDIVSVQFNHFYCMEICDKLRRDLAMLTYIYINVDEC